MLATRQIHRVDISAAWISVQLGHDTFEVAEAVYCNMFSSYRGNHGLWCANGGSQSVQRMEVQLVQRVAAFLLQLGPILSQWHPCTRGPAFKGIEARALQLFSGLCS